MASFLCVAIGSLLALLTPLILKWLIDEIIPQRRMSLLGLAVLLIFLGHQGRLALTSLGSYLTLSSAQKLGLTLRMRLVRHLDTLSAEYYEQTPVGAAMYPLQEPVEEVAYFGSDLVPAFLRMLLTTSFTLATMLTLSPRLTLVVLPLLPIFLLTRHYFRRKLATNADSVQQDRVAWSKFLEEHLAAAISIQLMGQEKRQERRAFRLLARTVRSQQKVYRTAAWFSVCSSLAVVLAMCAVIGQGGKSALSGSFTVGSLVAFYGLVTQLFDPLSGAAELYARAQKTFASIRQVQSTLALRMVIFSKTPAIHLAKQHPLQIDFVDVEFQYARQQDLLRIPKLHIFAGERVAIAGENGAGKSTLAKLMVRLYDPLSGLIGLGGEDIRNIDLRSLRQQVCYLAREPVLFDGTVASNLRFVRPGASTEQLQEALRQVELAPLVAGLPDGLRQRIGPQGCQLSGGERQRLALARALLQRPSLLILDEATSCLDAAGEAVVLHNLQHNLAYSTLIVISHRPATFSDFRRVLVLARGKIVEDGNFDFSIAAQKNSRA